MSTHIRKIRVYPSPGSVARAGAKLLLETVRFTVGEAGGRCAVALSGGSTPRELYACLTTVGDDDRELLRRVDWFFGDERAVANDHEESNVGAAVRGFLEPLGVPAERVHRLYGDAPDLGVEARRATSDLLRAVPSATRIGIPEFDLIFLGLGADGHTASLFPGTDALHVGYPDWCGYVANTVPQLNTRRLTLSFEVLNVARHLVFLVTGEPKAAILRQVLQYDEPRELYPVDRVRARRVTWVLDQAAASQLTIKTTAPPTTGSSEFPKTN